MSKIGSFTSQELKELYSTPLYVMDEEKIRKQCRLFVRNFQAKGISTNIVYAGKAFLTTAMVKLINEEGLFLDCVSQGELITALNADFPPEKIVLHGNNKTKEELKFALDNKVGIIVLDNDYEAEILKTLVNENQQANVMLRINPGIAAHTHEYIKTSTQTSKFGMWIDDPKTFKLIKDLSNYKNIKLLGTHSHIGSQILNEGSFYEHTRVMLDFYKSLKDKLGINLTHLNLGGGFGIKYLETDQELHLEKVLKKMIKIISDQQTNLDLDIKHLYIEPGRSIVGEAGVTIYNIDQVKTTFHGKNFIFIDGSMNDHIRTALYQAEYSAYISNKEAEDKTVKYTVVGKACESGDIIIKDIMLPQAFPNDLLVVKSTGAYHYSMASNYNHILRPAVVFVNKDKSRLVVKRETYKDLLKREEI